MNLLRNATLLVLPLALSACMIPTGPVEVTRFNRVAEGVVYGKRRLFDVTPGDAAAGDTPQTCRPTSRRCSARC
jgi:hypothetical protein